MDHRLVMREILFRFTVTVVLPAYLLWFAEPALGQQAPESAPVDSAPASKAKTGKKAGKGTTSPEQRTKEFQQRDVNQDGQLTLDEHLARREGDARAAAHNSFFRWDRNGDDRLSLEEFVSREPGQQLTTHSLFRSHDLDVDGLLTEQEFMRTRIGKKFEQAGRENFQKFDVNHDRRLSEREFAMTPAQQPTKETLFLGLDVNDDGVLVREEFLALFADSGQRRGHREFVLHDRDRDGRLSLLEYVQDVDVAAAGNNDFELIDSDADGAVTLAEFCKQPPPKRTDEVASRRYEIALMKAEDGFRAADLDHDGKLTAEEFGRANRDQMLATDEEIGDEVEPPTDNAVAKPSFASGTGSKKWDLFVPLMIVGESLIGVAIISWWLARRRRPKSSQQRISPLNAHPNPAEL